MSQYPTGDVIQCYSGVYFRPLDPDVQDVYIEDIAHALSLLCRFAGHCEGFYSVAEHSLRVSIALECYGTEISLWGLLHDASEAYLVDIPRPIKHDPRFAFYRIAESVLMRVICERFALPCAEPIEVSIMDKRMLVTEARDLLKNVRVDEWASFGDPLEAKILPLTSREAETQFIDRFNHLMSLRMVAEQSQDEERCVYPECQVPTNRERHDYNDMHDWVPCCRLQKPPVQAQPQDEANGGWVKPVNGILIQQVKVWAERGANCLCLDNLDGNEYPNEHEPGSSPECIYSRIVAALESKPTLQANDDLGECETAGCYRKAVQRVCDDCGGCGGFGSGASR